MASDTLGLSNAEAHARLRDVGPNESAATGDHTLRNVLASVAGEPMFLLLLAAAALYLAVGCVPAWLEPRSRRSCTANAPAGPARPVLQPVPLRDAQADVSFFTPGIRGPV